MPLNTNPQQHMVPAIRNWYQETYDTIHLHCLAAKLDDPVLTAYAHDGIVVLSCGDRSCRDFRLENGRIRFHTTFNMTGHHVDIPADCVVGLAAHNQDRTGGHEFFPLPVLMDETPPPQPRKATGPKLTVVK